MAAKLSLLLAVIVTVSLLCISSSNARATKSMFGKLTRREAVASEISVAPAPSTTVEDLGYGLYSSSEDGDDVSEQTPRYDTRYDVDPSQQTDFNDNYNSHYSDDSDSNSYSYSYSYNGDDKSQRQGLSDTRFQDNYRSYYNNNNNNDNDNDNGGRSYDVGEGQRYEFDSMEEYQKYQEAHPYLP